MKLNRILKTSASIALAWSAALVLALLMASNAQARCGLTVKLAQPASGHLSSGGARVVQGESAKDSFDGEDDALIVGMWHVVFTAQTSNGAAIPDTVIDNALAVWHSDKTEIMNSVRPPQDGDFCMGVWQQTGKSKYYLNHFAWFANAFPNDTNNGIGDPVGPTHITETVTLSPDGKSFSGTFTLDAYDTTGKISQSFTGLISAKRITTSTTVGDLL
jgi:hypothetical protein